MKRTSFLTMETDPQLIFVPEEFPSEAQELARKASEFVEIEVLPRISEIESQNWNTTLFLLRKAARLGLLSMTIPRAYGGANLGKAWTAFVLERLSVTGSFGVSLGVHAGIGTLPLVYFGNQEQRARFLPRFASGECISCFSVTELTGGGHVSISTKAKLSPDGKTYVLNGTKKFLSNAGIADVYVVLARVDDKYYTEFIVEKGMEGLTLGKEEDKMGLRGVSNRMLYLSNVRVPLGNVLGPVGKGHRIAASILHLGRFLLSCGSVGLCKAILNACIGRATTREIQGKPIARFGIIQQKLAEMAAASFCVESMLYRVAGAVDGILSSLDAAQDIPCETVVEMFDKISFECTAIKAYVPEILARVVDEGIQVFGGYGFIEDYPLARYYRDSRVFRIFEGTTEVMRLQVAQMLLAQIKRGELPAVMQPQGLLEKLDRIMAGAEAGQGRLSKERGVLILLKQLALLLLGLVSKRSFLEALEQQEVMDCISQIALHVYALESALLRVERILSDQRPKPQQFITEVIKALAHEAAAKVVTLARDVLAVTCSSDEAAICLDLLGRIFQLTATNAVAIRRSLARVLLQAGSYTL